MAAKLGGSTGGDRYVIEQNSDINVTPFVDIMLVLLIIFMVSIPLATVSIKLDMPPPPKTTTPPKDKPIFIQIMNTGDILVVDQTVSLDELPATLGGMISKQHPEAGDPRGQLVFIKAEADVKYEKFMDVMNKLEDSGFLKVGLINEDIS